MARRSVHRPRRSAVVARAADLMLAPEVVPASTRLKAEANPVYVSPGHLVDLQSALALSLVWSSGRHRVPEPLAAAHTLSVEARREGNRE